MTQTSPVVAAFDDRAATYDQSVLHRGPADDGHQLLLVAESTR